jgi:hypothetical protein
MDRTTATEIVFALTYKTRGIKAVSMPDCQKLLGDRLGLLLSDQIRNKGPDKDSVYPWNVVDYLCHENPKAGSRNVGN